jgi:hypothetical protein
LSYTRLTNMKNAMKIDENTSITQCAFLPPKLVEGVGFEPT